MGKLVTAVRNCVAFLLGYTIRVYWEDQRTEHFAFTIEGAMEWMRCYPSEAQCFISFMGTHLLFARGQRD